MSKFMTNCDYKGTYSKEPDVPKEVLYKLTHSQEKTLEKL
jgi:hypothetical protein